jgi:hypothetical protein
MRGCSTRRSRLFGLNAMNEIFSALALTGGIF